MKHISRNTLLAAVACASLGLAACASQEENAEAPPAEPAPMSESAPMDSTSPPPVDATTPMDSPTTPPTTP